MEFHIRVDRKRHAEYINMDDFNYYKTMDKHYTMDFDIPTKAWNFIVYLMANLNVYVFPFIVLLGEA